ncbi:MAG: flagellar protein FliS [bacterium]|jgi:flagellar protein FliS
MNPYQKQANVYRKASVNTQDQGKMILALYENAIHYLSKAILKLNNEKVEEAHNYLIRGKSIISELRTTLSLEKGDEVAQNLNRLYSYIYDRLVDANIQKSPEIVQEAIDLITVLYEGWVEIIQPKKETQQVESKNTTRRFSV